MTTAAKTKKVYLRVGHYYVKTIGIYGALGGRSFGWPVDVAWDSQERLYVANRAEGNPRITILNLDEDYFGEFGGPRDGEGRMDSPAAIAIDRSDAIYVSDQSNHCVINYDPEGKFVTRWGVYGSAEGELKEPSGLALDDEDNLYVVDAGNNRIQKFTNDGKFLLAWGGKGSDEGQFLMPWGIALDDENNVYVSDWGNDRVQKFTAHGEFLMTVGTRGDGDGELRRPSGVAVDRGGDIYVADWANDRVQVFDPKGIYQLKFTGDATLSKWALEAMLASPDFARERHRATLEPERQLWRPNSVQVDPQDRIIISDTTRHRLQVYQKETVTVDADWIDLDNPKRELQFR
jgi:DNA-binding beta-propeller fold protein YncE